MLRSIRKRCNKFRLMHELAVKPWARYDANHNPPVPTEDTWAPIEVRLGQRFDDCATALLAKRERALKTERVSAINNELGLDARAFQPLVHATKQRIYTGRLKLNTRWAQVRAHARQCDKAVQDFKAENLLNRDAVYHPLILAFGVCAIAFVVETAANAALFAEVSRFGLTGGALNAMTLSLPNIVLGLAAGFWGMRARHHIRPLVHHTGSIVLVVSLTLALLWNFYVGHFRLHAEHLSHTRQELRLSDWQAVRAQILNDPAAPFASSPAVTLMLLGLIVVAISLFDGLYGFSDPYPGFARVDRRYRRGLRDVIATKQSMFRRLKRVTRRGTRSINQQRRAILAKTREALLILGRSHDIFTRFESRIDEQQWAHHECLCEYHTLNGRHRDQAPARFALPSLPGTRATRPLYDWQTARDEIDTRAHAADDAALSAITELEQHLLDIMAAIEQESSQVTHVPVLQPPLLLAFAPEAA